MKATTRPQTRCLTPTSSSTTIASSDLMTCISAFIYAEETTSVPGISQRSVLSLLVAIACSLCEYRAHMTILQRSSSRMFIAIAFAHSSELYCSDLNVDTYYLEYDTPRAGKLHLEQYFRFAYSGYSLQAALNLSHIYRSTRT